MTTDTRHDYNILRRSLADYGIHIVTMRASGAPMAYAFHCGSPAADYYALSSSARIATAHGLREAVTVAGAIISTIEWSARNNQPA